MISGVLTFFKRSCTMGWSSSMVISATQPFTGLLASSLLCQKYGWKTRAFRDFLRRDSLADCMCYIWREPTPSNYKVHEVNTSDGACRRHSNSRRMVRPGIPPTVDVLYCRIFAACKKSLRCFWWIIWMLCIGGGPPSRSR